MKIKNIFLTLSLAAFAVGFSDLRETPFFWMGLPIGAILFGLYMVFSVLENPTALLDQQEKEKWDRINDGKSYGFPKTQCQEICAPELGFEIEQAKAN